MTEDLRELYSSSNGDRWYLVRSDGRLLVRHVPNPPSGGFPSHTEVGAFLASGGKNPEHRALLNLIGTLVDGSADPKMGS